MRLTYTDLMEKLQVGYELAPYENCPWSVYDPEAGITCTAEVRVEPDGHEVTAEIQLMYDDPPPDRPAMEQLCTLHIAENNAKEWNTQSFILRNEVYGEDVDIYNWQEKSCRFFGAVVKHLKDDEVPDIEDLIERELHSRERFADQQGGGGGRSPKAKAGQLMGVKKGSGMK